MATCAVSFKLASSIVFHSPTEFLWIVLVVYQSCKVPSTSVSMYGHWVGGFLVISSGDGQVGLPHVRVLVCCSFNKVLVLWAVGVISIVFLSSAHLLISVPTQCLREASMLCNLPFFSPTICCLITCLLPGNWPLPVGRHVFTWYFEVSSCWLCVDCCSGKLLWSTFRSTRCLALVLCEASFSQFF